MSSVDGLATASLQRLQIAHPLLATIRKSKVTAIFSEFVHKELAVATIGNLDRSMCSLQCNVTYYVGLPRKIGS